MKFRRDFITNSSSSSFVIAIKKENNELPKDIEEKLLEWAKRQIFGNSDTITNIEELKEYFKDEYSWKHMSLEELLDEDVFASEDYEEYKKLIEDGFVIYKKWIPCEGQDQHLYMYEEAIELLDSSENFKGIETDLDY